MSWDLKRGRQPRHWLCSCGQPNASQRELCIDCGKTPVKKNYPQKIPTDSLRGGPKVKYIG